MSSIKKLSIQGIRSFGPDEKDKQVIEFFTPLTLILGPNGTGKTTIIECLKYMTTGEMPPNAKINAAFIHDPKVANEREVKAQVRLQFKDVRQQSVVATRSLTATQKQKKTEMKTLEGVITRINEHGDKYSISSRCAEMDREVVSLLGVSKPVLENVIFCHQEDSNWPLSEGKALKQRFDDIFASTRYVKALDVIRKTKIEQATNLKEYAAEIKYLKMNKEQAAELRCELEEREARYIASKESVGQVNQKLEPIEEQLERIGKRTNEIYNLRTKIDKLKVEKQEMEKGVEELRENISKDFEGSTEELQRALRDFKSNVQEKEEELQGLKTELETLERKATKIGKEKSAILLDQGKLQQEAEANRQTVGKRDRLLAKTAEAYQLDGFSGAITDSHVARFLKALEEKAKSILTNNNELKEEFEEQEKAILAEKDAKTNTKTKLATEMQMKSDQLKSSNAEVKSINQKLSEVEASAGRLDNLTSELKRAENELRDVEESLDIEVIKAEVKQLGEDKAKYDAELKRLDIELNRMSRETGIRSELEVHKKEKTSKDDQIHRLRAKNEDALRHLLGTVPEQGLCKSLNAYIGKQTRTAREAANKLEMMKRQLAGLEMDKKNQMEQLKRKEEDQKEYSGKISEVCNSPDLDLEVGMKTTEEEMSNNQKIMAYVKGTEHVYSRFMDKMENDNEKCPLCMMRFPSEAEAEELVQSMEHKLSLVPEKVMDIEEKLEKCKKKYEGLLELRPIKAALMDIEREDLPNLRAKVTALSKKIEELNGTIEHLEEELETLQADEAQAKAMVTDMTLIDRYNSELKDVVRKISVLTSKMSGDDSGKTMQEINQEREDLQLQLETINRNIERKNVRKDEYQEQVGTLRGQVNDIGRDKLQIESDLQQRSRLEKRKEELQDIIEVLHIEVDECRQQLQPLDAEIRKLQKDLRDVAAEKEEKVEKSRNEFNKIKSRGKEIGNLGGEIQHYVDAGKDQELDEKKEKMIVIAKELKDIETQKESTSADINKIQKDLAAQKMKERELVDNMSMRRKQQEIKRKVEEIEEENAQLGGLDVRNMVQEERKLRENQEKLIREKHTAQGRLQGFEDEIKTMRKNLRTESYVDAEEKFTAKMIDLKTTEMASSDLDKYYKALDKAIMTYHGAKMAEINKIVRELWAKTYKGNDIETIEIRSDDEGPATAAKRRVYNYRVVMIKGETALDMRGRCSAGQKVLASLIIRLALAETFCLNCGILALDEPTTNLDRENIESLAYALAEIIKSRQRQRNFQLLIITHDEDFVELLGRSDYVEEFFKVRKNDLGCSQLVKARVADLHSR